MSYVEGGGGGGGRLGVVESWGIEENLLEKMVKEKKSVDERLKES